MKLRSLSLTLANVARTSRDNTLEAVNAGIQKKRDENGGFTEEREFVYVECAVRRGDLLKVKFPAELSDKIVGLQHLLESDEIINISFVNLRLIPYAMTGNNGSIISGVSAKADDFTIESPDASGLDDIEI